MTLLLLRRCLLDLFTHFNGTIAASWLRQCRNVSKLITVPKRTLILVANHLPTPWCARTQVGGSVGAWLGCSRTLLRQRHIVGHRSIIILAFNALLPGRLIRRLLLLLGSLRLYTSRPFLRFFKRD